MYMMWVYKNFQNKVFKRDDPFSNANMFNLLLFMIYLHKYLIEILLQLTLGDSSPYMR